MDKSLSSLVISSDHVKIDKEFVIKEIQLSYWGSTRSRETILRSLETSLCFSAFFNGKQVAFARVITDYAAFAYLCDVVVSENYRGQHVGTKLLEFIFKDESLKHVDWLLRTKDAQGLYEKFGFEKTKRPDRYMEMKKGPKALSFD